jgi:hypothetical protein
MLRFREKADIYVLVVESFEYRFERGKSLRFRMPGAILLRIGVRTLLVVEVSRLPDAFRLNHRVG